MSTFQGKTVLVTGGAMGLGRLMAERSLAEGAKCAVLWDINEAALNKTAEELRAHGHDVRVYGVNIADLESIKQAAAATLAELGAIDILFNNAGIVVGKTFVEHSHEDLDRTIRINTLGVMHVARAFVPKMIEQRSGHVVNIASAAALMAVPRQSAYCPSKWACYAFSEVLRLEMEQANTGVHVTTVCPGYINTGMFAGAKAPLLTPILEPPYVVDEIIKAVKADKIHLKLPFMVKLLPLMRGTHPVRLFDFVAAKLFRAYSSMDAFKGH